MKNNSIKTGQKSGTMKPFHCNFTTSPEHTVDCFPEMAVNSVTPKQFSTVQPNFQ